MNDESNSLATHPNAAHAGAADELQDDALTGRVRILQRKHGHRYSLDDVLTAYVALQARPDAHKCLDLGCGIGSVLLMLADKLEHARLWGIEAQDVSFGLVQRNIARNLMTDRVRAEQGDLREGGRLDGLLMQLRLQDPSCTGFDLVTGTPPYMPPGTGTPSPDSQRAHARMELRGGVEEYLVAAGRVVANDGVVVVCAQSGAEARVQAGAALAGLVPIARMDAIAMRGRQQGLFAVHTLVRARDARGVSLQVAPPFVARDENGVRTEAANAVRRFFGHDAPVGEAPSPRLRTRSTSVSQER